MATKDPIGKAIRDTYSNKWAEDIIVESDLSEDDTLPVSYLFRSYDDMPVLERQAMENCTGSVLDIGAAAGPHTTYLIENEHTVSTIEASLGAHQYLTDKFPKATHYHRDINAFNEHQYDTLLLLMNGIGIAKRYDSIVPFLKHLSTLLTDDGKIICDSTDVSYFFEEEDGGMWVDLNSNYFGEFKFNMKYKDEETGWFEWIYLDLNKFEILAQEAGLSLSLLGKEGDSFLVELKKIP